MRKKRYRERWYSMRAKGGDADIVHQIVELKTELERIREQVQNVE